MNVYYSMQARCRLACGFLPTVSEVSLGGDNLRQAELSDHGLWALSESVRRRRSNLLPDRWLPATQQVPEMGRIYPLVATIESGAIRSVLGDVMHAGFRDDV